MCKTIQYIIPIIIFFVLIHSNKGLAETNYLPPDPFLIIGDNNDLSNADEIATKIAQLQEQNKKMRSKVLSLQDLLISKFKDRMELKVEVISKNSERELPQFGVIELSAIINNISLIHYNKPIFFDRKIYLPIFNGPLPLGTYKIKINGIVGQFNNNWPYVLPQGKWKIEKEIDVIGTLSSPIHDIKIVLRQNSMTKLPELITEDEEQKGN
ncbi:hypothetical protein QEJ31_08505 [Pigmentibacter sp. JX0631]|uniref:hypothetical protein n=1 Tax=Pigmentibacter sp. JX0631 TaxID=2976982 RepID=UPI002469036F|nr:hypothetical protein [Pigmentibacter sp. JX0631]WGL58576.1 hypothetical protein QEJ31_08505 [Pigmentibacter sp. JX0631]